MGKKRTQPLNQTDIAHWSIQIYVCKCALRPCMSIYRSLNKWIDVHQQTGGTKNIANTHENFDVMPLIEWIYWKKRLHQITIEKILIVQIWSDWLDENTSRTAFHRFWHFFFGQKFLDAGPGTPAAVGRRAELVSDTFSIQISRFGPWKITDCQANLVAFGPNNISKVGSAYFCIFCICKSWLHILHIRAYACIFFAYFCIFLLIKCPAYFYIFFAYFCIFIAYQCIFFLHISCIFIHILCIFVHMFCI